ncbi:hypothetical protein [Demequina sp. NBRC 110055]|uniref:hypothetical protein n=1 Tax=Demequina sp. NBRC 110055 TaxID=1570344 RepID=UPI0009FCD128|nr:hypothetical protein [Demequina sp. NBRC 110055]
MSRASTPHAERDVDALVAGRPVADPDLAALSPVVAALRASATATPTDSQAAAMAATLAAAVAPAGGAPAARRSPWRRRVGATVAVVGVLGLSFAGAAAADAAAPGDALYGLDRVLERVGVNAGGAEERLDEVRVLVDRGDVDRATDLATETLDDLDEGDAAEGLREAAVSVLAHGAEQSHDTRTRVSEMLLWMADQDTRGAEFGAAVSERARGLLDEPTVAAGEATDARTSETGADQVPDAPSPVSVGQPENAHQSESTGESAEEHSAGRTSGAEGEGADVPAPAEAEVPTAAGKPDTSVATGKPENAGKPDAVAPVDERGQDPAPAVPGESRGEGGKP